MRNRVGRDVLTRTQWIRDDEVFVGRQPIYDKALSVVGHELLFRCGHGNAASFRNGEEATSQVILNAFIEIGLDRIVGQGRVFVNFTRDLLTDDCIKILPPDRCVLEVLESVSFDAEIEAALGALRKAGYLIALDDYTHSEASGPLLEFADFVKLDLKASIREELPKTVRFLRGTRAKLVAEKIDTLEEFRFCRDLGFDLFQGYFLSRPEIVQGTRSPAGRTSALMLLARCRDSETDFQAVTGMVKQNAELSYKLLRMANSALYNLKTRVDSVDSAVFMLGVETVYRLAVLLVLSGLSDKPTSYLALALQRAYMCEFLGGAINPAGRNQLHTIGLLSALDVLLNKGINEVIDPLPLSGETRLAIAVHEGDPGRVLDTVMAYEEGDWGRVLRSGFDFASVRDAYWRAVTETEQSRELLGTP